MNEWTKYKYGQSGSRSRTTATQKVEEHSRGDHDSVTVAQLKVRLLTHHQIKAWSTMANKRQWESSGGKIEKWKVNTSTRLTV